MFLQQVTVLLLCFYFVKSEEIEVVSSFGQIRGLKVEINNGTDSVYQFRNIPYAVPPVGKLRFQKPVPHGPLSGVYDATKFGPTCVQRTNGYFKLHNISEDCLQLNIYVPHYVGSVPRPVMVWIHGGGFYLGSASQYDASYLAVAGDVIIVTINYRLGLFGFFSTEDKRHPGNYGLWDALEAIKWTNRHIRSFGGNPNQITIFGQSAGAYISADLMVSPQSKGLFQRAILESGGDFRPDIFDRETKETTIRALQYIDCLDMNVTQITDDSLRCLLQADSNDILNATDYITNNSGFLLPVGKRLIGPVIDGELITGVPVETLKNVSSDAAKVFNSVDLLLGFNSAEGVYVVQVLEQYQKQFQFNISEGIPTRVLCQHVATSLSKQYYKSNDQVTSAMCGGYTTLSGPEEQGRAAMNLIGDWVFSAPMKMITDLHAKSPRSTYQYFFSKPLSPRLVALPAWVTGACHGEEMFSIFGVGAFKIARADRTLSNQMMRYWTNFAKTGNPNKAGSGDPYWPSYKSRKAYLQLDDHVTARHDLLSQRLVTLLETVPRIIANEDHVGQPFG